MVFDQDATRECVPVTSASQKPEFCKRCDRCAGDGKSATVVPSQVFKGWMAWNRFSHLMSQGKLLTIDGGMGTELDRRGAAMDSKGWSCAVQLTHPELVTEVHGDYIDSGADIVIANTYASNHNVMNQAGIGHRTHEAIFTGIQCAREACAKFGQHRPEPPLVAGSMSSHPPEITGGSSCSAGSWPAVEVEKQNYEIASTALASSGCDIIVLEMMKNMTHSMRAIEAASKSGMPIMLGISTKIGRDGKLRLYGDGMEDLDVEEFTVDVFASMLSAAGPNVVAVNVMHTKFDAVLPTLKMMRRLWSGLMGVYPDHGIFRMPRWEFMEIDNAAVEAYVESWVMEAGVNMVGGCCGLGPDFIKLVNRTLKRLETAKAQPAAEQTSQRSTQTQLEPTRRYRHVAKL